ncbi:MAG: hypothetical protein LBI48_02430 [Burkholderiaceae bacterium]|jgi:hypothetical protein|nr:hypothetical protein [Burkholderiaceae bacterium]
MDKQKFLDDRPLFPRGGEAAQGSNFDTADLHKMKNRSALCGMLLNQ